MLDIETLDQESSSVILSIALVYFETKIPVLVQNLKRQSVFVKIDVNEQRKKYNRTVSKETLSWWQKQSADCQEKSLIPNSADMSVEAAFDVLSNFFRKHGGSKRSHLYSRGSFDVIIVDSLIRVAGLKPLVHFSNHRDVRTFLTCIYPNTKDGYVEVDDENCPDFKTSTLIKHDPTDDCILDIVQMLAGKQE